MHKRPGETPWLLIIGLFLGAGFLGFMAYDSFFSRPFKTGPAAGKHVVVLTSANWQKEVIESTIPVLVDVTAPWCGPCQILAPTIDKLAETYQGKVKVGKLDLDSNSKIAGQFGIKSIPTVMIFKGGTRVRSFTGVESEATYVHALEAALAD